MLLLTGATGTIGLPLVRRLEAAGTPIRCLVRDPSRLGSERSRVEVALGDLADPPSFDRALRGVNTVVHLASVIRAQPGGSIEELAGVAFVRAPAADCQDPHRGGAAVARSGGPPTRNGWASGRSPCARCSE